MCIKTLLILLVEGPAWLPLINCSLVGWSEYQGVRGFSGAVSLSGKGLVVPFGASGGERGMPWGIDSWDNGVCCLDADRPGLGGLVGDWARLTKSNPNELDSLSDSGIWWLLNGARVDCVNFISFAGNQVSSNFTSQEISKCWWAASQNWYHLDPGSYLTKIISQLLGSSLCLLGVSNTAGAALWALDYTLYASQIGVTQVHFHDGIGYKYNFVSFTFIHPCHL